MKVTLTLTLPQPGWEFAISTNSRTWNVTEQNNGDGTKEENIYVSKEKTSHRVRMLPST
jgi:hypothetical protein